MEDHHITPKKKSSTINREENDSIFHKLNNFTAGAVGTGAHSPRLPSIKDFCIVKPISRGAFGKVFLGYKKNDQNKLFAIKVMRKSEMINKNMASQVVTERKALALSRSPFCVTLYYSLQTLSSIYLVMEYMIGGDLKSLLAMYGFFEEAAARFYAAEICLALEYLHKHGIVHRDIKPDNMLISASGHVKLTDFGLSRIEMGRDLEISDLINRSPNFAQHARTPGQLLSLTSHLSFGSHEKQQQPQYLSCNQRDQRFCRGENDERTVAAAGIDAEEGTEYPHASYELNDSDGSFSHGKSNDSKMSGINPFFSAEQNVSIVESMKQLTGCQPVDLEDRRSDESSSYYTCSSSTTGSNESAKNACKRMVGVVITNDVDPGGNKENVNTGNNHQARGDHAMNDLFGLGLVGTHKFKMLVGNNDSGISSRKSDFSHNPEELSAIEKAGHDEHTTNSHKREESSSCSDMSRNSMHFSYSMSNLAELSNSPVRNGARCFKRPEYFRGIKRKRHLVSRVDSLASDPDGSGTACSGLTQEIDVLDIGSSTPKKRKDTSPLRPTHHHVDDTNEPAAAAPPIKSVLKVRSLSDDEMPLGNQALGGNVMFSTPVSSQKVRREGGGQLGKLKSTRFMLPSSVEQATQKMQPFIKIADECVMSPICTSNSTHAAATVEKTPKTTTVKTPFRTPKSVRRAPLGSDERILGTPDYLAPELLLQQGHGPAVDWWALGVCLYEFMTGVPPFNDETPTKVFENILSRNIEWPQDEESLSREAVEAVESLLEMDPGRRPQAEQVMRMAFFAPIDWQCLETEAPPFVPSPDDPQDTGYFEARNIMQALKLSQFDMETQ